MGRTVLDLGFGFGGRARYLAGRCGCRVVALNVSEPQNERRRRTNAAQRLDGLIEVVTGSFEDIPYPPDSFDVVWSQEAFCHSGDRHQLLAEAVRFLNPQGELVSTAAGHESRPSAAGRAQPYQPAVLDAVGGPVRQAGAGPVRAPASELPVGAGLSLSITT
ncbi:SAM-dependent methyltransferase [Streptomyces vinaceus]|uniref:SAM-dependent methyltransferase n=1 Tax=Streptomyces vinaceus TaxID=1960 RepID=UPI0038133F2E